VKTNYFVANFPLFGGGGDHQFKKIEKYSSHFHLDFKGVGGRGA